MSCSLSEFACLFGSSAKTIYGGLFLSFLFSRPCIGWVGPLVLALYPICLLKWYLARTKKKKTKNDVRSPSKVEATTRVFYTWEFDVESVSYENISCIIYPVSELSPVSVSCNIFYFSLRSWIIFLYCCWKWRLIRLHYPSTWLTDLNITQDLIH